MNRYDLSEVCSNENKFVVSCSCLFRRVEKMNLCRKRTSTGVWCPTGEIKLTNLAVYGLKRVMSRQENSFGISTLKFSMIFTVSLTLVVVEDRHRLRCCGPSFLSSHALRLKSLSFTCLSALFAEL